MTKKKEFRYVGWNAKVRTSEQILIDILRFPKIAINHSIAVKSDYQRQPIVDRGKCND